MTKIDSKIFTMLQEFCVDRDTTIPELMAVYEVHGRMTKKTGIGLIAEARHKSDDSIILPKGYLELAAIAHTIDDVLTVNVAEGIRISIRADAVYPFKSQKHLLYTGSRIDNLVTAGVYIANAIDKLKP